MDKVLIFLILLYVYFLVIFLGNKNSVAKEFQSRYDHLNAQSLEQFMETPVESSVRQPASAASLTGLQRDSDADGITDDLDSDPFEAKKF